MAEDKPQLSGPFFEVQQEVRRLFQELIHQPWGGRSTLDLSRWQPCCDVAETDEAIIVEIELPGMERKDVHVEVEGETLRITGERRATVKHQARHYYRMERSYGRFERQLRLPSSVDRERIHASFRAGILTLTLPKKDTEKTSRRPGKEPQ
jgi:HSP20 family protein